MFKICSIFSTFLFLQFSNNGFAQFDTDTIILLNGSMVITSIIDTTNGVISFKNPKNDKKNFIIENDRVFSIKNSSGEYFIYVYDTLIGNEFTIQEMKYFIAGEQDAQKGFKARGSLFGNVAVGAAAGITGSFLSPIAPFAFTALVGIPKVKIKHKTVSNLEYLKQDTYLMGYERVARKKRKIKSLIGGGIGLGVGLGTFFILKSTDNELIK